jgi:hypothetical protein
MSPVFLAYHYELTAQYELLIQIKVNEYELIFFYINA